MKTHLFALITMVALVLPGVCVAQMDKALHASAGFGITLTVAATTHRPKLGLFAGVGAGVAKEFWDSHHAGHTPSARDAVATAAASAAAYALLRYVFMKKPPVRIASVDDKVPPAASAVRRESAARPVAVTPTSASEHAQPGGGM